MIKIDSYFIEIHLIEKLFNILRHFIYYISRIKIINKQIFFIIF